MSAHHTNNDSKTVVLVGQTGMGKSQLGNALLGRRGAFLVSDAADSVTTETVSETVQLGSGTTLRVFDCPGMDDSDGRDSEHNVNMHGALRGVRDCAAFLLVVNMTTHRMSGSMRGTVAYMLSTFGHAFRDRLVVVATHALRNTQFRRPAQQQRYRGKVQPVLNELLGLDADHVHPWFFVDTDEELRRADVDEDLAPIRDYLRAETRVASLEGTAIVRAEKDALRDKIEHRDREISALEVTVEDTSAALAKANDDRDDLARKVDRLADQISDLKTREVPQQHYGGGGMLINPLAFMMLRGGFGGDDWDDY